MAISNERRSGGIALFWKKNFVLTITSFSKFHIHAKVKEEGEDVAEWFLTGIYGPLSEL